MFIIDVIRHGGGAHFQGLIARLNDGRCIGWRRELGREFTVHELRSKVKQMILDGDLVLESMWDGRGQLTAADALTTVWSDEILISNTERAMRDWDRWNPPVAS